MEMIRTLIRLTYQEFDTVSHSLEMILDNATHGIILLNQQKKVTFWNKKSSLIFGWKVEEVIGTELPIIHKEQEAEFQDKLAQAENGATISGWESVCRKKEGLHHYISLSVIPFKRKDKVIGFIVIARDITAIKARQNQLDQSLSELRDVKYALDASTLFTISDIDGNIIDANDNFCKVSKYTLEELIGQNHRIINSGYHPEELFQEMWSTIQSGRVWTGELRNRAKDGEIFWAQSTIVPFLNAQGNTYQYMAIRIDITAKKKAEEEIRKKEEAILYAAQHDYLTGIPNRRLLEEVIETEIVKAKQSSTLLVFFFLDIDNFKYINDTMGHDQGDLLLIEVANRLTAFIANRGNVARIGGDEFSILLPNLINMESVREAAEQILRLFQEPMILSDYELQISVSIGITVYPLGVSTTKELMKNSGLAMYRAKLGGKSQYKIYSPSMDVKTYKQFRLQNDLKKAIAENQFRLQYQPRVNKEGKIMSAEALIRWEHPEWGTVSPAEFIELAEKTVNIIVIGNWVLENVCKQINEWRQEGITVPRVSINVSAVQFMQSDFLEKFKKVIDFYQIDPRNIEIELTESAVMSNEKDASRKIRFIQEKGIQVALDDFGTGYSSLNYLKKFKVDTVKIDQSFIKDIDVDVESAEITNAVIQLSKSLRIKTVAEGVETERQLYMLDEMGCDEHQGYLFSKPLSTKEFKVLLRKGKCDLYRAWKKAPQINKRIYYRIELLFPIEADMTILSIGGKKVDIASTTVLINNIGPGGICFTTNIRLPIKSDFLLQFSTTILTKNISMEGTIAWGSEIERGIYQYGLQFEINEEKRTKLTALFNLLQVKLKDRSILPDCRFIKMNNNVYFSTKE